jgi:hypothetical protein
MAGTFQSRWARLGVCLCALAAVTLALVGQAPPARAASCPPIPGTLAPNAKTAAARFTMMIRIQNQSNVNAYVNPNEATGGLADRIRPQDIFVINTRFQDQSGSSSPSLQAQLIPQLRAAFPCNRIVALNGLGPDPTQPGYLYALADQGLYALMIDWEPADWADAQTLTPSIPPFTYIFKKALRRMNGWARAISANLGGIPGGTGTRVGMVPIEQGKYWDYGQIGQTLDANNTRLGGRHAGVQSVMTQASCTAGGPTFGARLKPLLDEYVRKTIYLKRRKVKGHGKKRHVVTVRIPKKVKIPKKQRPNQNSLAVQISFTSFPQPGNPMPILATGAPTADQCVAAGLARGAGAFFFWASEDSMRLLFQQPTVASLRPPA